MHCLLTSPQDRVLYSRYLGEAGFFSSLLATFYIFDPIPLSRLSIPSLNPIYWMIDIYSSMNDLLGCCKPGYDCCPQALCYCPPGVACGRVGSS